MYIPMCQIFGISPYCKQRKLNFSEFQNLAEISHITPQAPNITQYCSFRLTVSLSLISSMVIGCAAYFRLHLQNNLTIVRWNAILMAEVHSFTFLVLFAKWAGSDVF